MWNFLGKILLSRVKQCIWKKHKRPSPILWSQYSDGKFLWTVSIIHITEDYNIWMVLFVVSEIYFGQMKLCLHLFKGLRRLQESFKGRKKNPHFTSVSNTTPVRSILTFVSRQMSWVASHWLRAIQSVVSKHWCLFQRRAATLAIEQTFCFVLVKCGHQNYTINRWMYVGHYRTWNFTSKRLGRRPVCPEEGE